MTWLDRWERRLGFLAIPGLASFLAGMKAAVGLLSLFKPEFPFVLSLDAASVRAGQIWRLITFVFVPPSLSPLWLFLWLALFFAYARALEQEWGDARLTFYCLLGAVIPAGVALALNASVSDALFDTSLFLAFARLNPDYEILLFFVLPVKMRWLEAAAWLWLGCQFLLGGLLLKAMLVAGLANYLLFFGEGLWRDARRAWRGR